MIVSKLKFILLFALTIVLFSNCDKKQEEDKKTTVAEDKENISKLFDDVVATTKDIKMGCGVQSLDKFFNIDGGVAQNTNWADNIFRSFESYIGINTTQNSKFDFSNHTGTYTWNHTLNSWQGTAAPLNKIVVAFPVEMNATTNSAILTADYYNDQNVSYNSYSYWLPTSFFAALNVDNQTCASADLKSATYDNTSSFQIPTSIELDLVLDPYLFEVKMNKTSATTINLEIVAKTDGKQKFAIAADLTYEHSNYQNLHLTDDCNTAEGTLTYGDFEIPFTADFKTVKNLLNPSNTQINELFDANILYKGDEIASLDFIENNNAVDILIKYKDGSEESTDTYYNNFLDKLELVLLEFTGNW